MITDGKGYRITCIGYNRNRIAEEGAETDAELKILIKEDGTTITSKGVCSKRQAAVAIAALADLLFDCAESMSSFIIELAKLHSERRSHGADDAF